MLPQFEKYLAGFCERNDIVVGAPGTVFFVGEHGVLEGILAICQQLEQRVWVGLRYVGKLGSRRNCIRICPDKSAHLVFLPGLKEPVPFTDFRPPVGSSEWPDKVRALEHLIEGLTQRPACRGFLNLDGAPFDLSILSEVRSGSGCNFSGAFSVGAVVAIHLASVWLGNADCVVGAGRFQEAKGQIVNLLGQGTQDLPDDPYNPVGRINRAAWVLETYFHGGRASGYGTTCSLVPTRWPMAYLRETPSRERVPGRIDLPWEAFQGRAPSGDEWKTIDRLLLDPETGLQCAVGLFEKAPSLVLNPDSQLPFAFGTIYSGHSKDTASAIKKVLGLRDEIADNLEGELSFFLKNPRVSGRFPTVSRPTFFQGLQQIQNTDHATSMRIVHAGIMWASMLVAHALCRVIRTASQVKSVQGEMDLAMSSLAEATRAAQGGLCQLFLVDPEASRITECVMDAFREYAGQIALKYTGGARGGDLFCIAPYSLSVAKLREGLDGLAGPDDQRPEWDRARVDYWSTEDAPMGDGIYIFHRANAEPPARNELLTYKTADGDVWVLADKASVGEWQADRSIADGHRDRCTILFDLRPGKEPFCKLFVGNTEMRTLGRDPAEGARRGIDALGAVIWCMLDNTGTATCEQVRAHAKEYGLEAEAYLKSARNIRALILTPLRARTDWSAWFCIACEDVQGPGQYRLRLKAGREGMGQFCVYVRRK